MLQRISGIACAFVVVLACSRAAQATPFTYSESVSGDLGTFVPAPTVFAFNIGDNTVSGHFFMHGGVSPTQDLDAFAFSVPAGDSLIGVTLAWTMTSSQGLTSATPTFRLTGANSFAPVLGTNSFNLLSASNPQSLFATVLPRGAGTYAIQITSLAETPGNGLFDVDYTWHINVQAAVPEPASLVLLGTGLALARRRWSR